MTDRLLAAGCAWVDPVGWLPPSLPDRRPRPGDEAFRFVTGRRPVIESVIAAAAQEQPGVTVRRGVRVTGLVGGPSAIPGVPHVAGVRTAGGEDCAPTSWSTRWAAVVRGYLGDPAGFARAWDEGTERTVAPFYRNQLRADRARLAEMTALREGRTWSPTGSIMNRLAAAAFYDADLFRALLETVMCLALPQAVIERPGIRDKVEQSDHHVSRPAPGPDRRELLQLLAA